MAMFDKPGQGTETSMSPGTVVGGNVKLTGTLKDVNDITVHGQVEGEIISDRIVTIAETARVKGPITATTVLVAGTVNGDITASERCELLPSAQLSGSVTTTNLSIKSGAVFNGKASMAVSNDRPTPTPAELRESEVVEQEEPEIVIEDEAIETIITPAPAMDAAPAAESTEPSAELED